MIKSQTPKSIKSSKAIIPNLFNIKKFADLYKIYPKNTSPFHLQVVNPCEINDGSETFTTSNLTSILGTSVTCLGVRRRSHTVLGLREVPVPPRTGG